MCGRYTFGDTTLFKERFKFQNQLEDMKPSYNVAPGQLMPVIVAEPERVAKTMRWGLIPSWAHDPNIGYRLINARAESIADKPAFRQSFLSKRCLIPATGFYEWLKTEKQPYYYRLKDNALFGFAGLYDAWLDAEKRPLFTYTIITTQANATVAPVHNRMPVMLKPDEEAAWLDPGLHDADALEKMLQPYPAELMESYPVGKQVNSPENDTQQLIRQV